MGIYAFFMWERLPAAIDCGKIGDTIAAGSRSHESRLHMQAVLNQVGSDPPIQITNNE